MVILKKIRSATLVEALVATVLIIIIFIVASLILNSLLFTSFSRNTHAVQTRISELEYAVRYDNIKLPYKEEFGNWDITLEKEQINDQQWLISNAVNKENKKEVIKSNLYAIQ